MSQRLALAIVGIAFVTSCGRSRRGSGDDDDDRGDADAEADADADADAGSDADADSDGDSDADGDGDADAYPTCEERLCCIWTGYSGPIAELSEFEWRDICQQTADYWGGEGFRCDCPDGVGVGVPPDWVETDCVPERADFGSCGLTVEQFEDCSDDIALDPCANGEGSEACAAVYACPR